MADFATTASLADELVRHAGMWALLLFLPTVLVLAVAVALVSGWRAIRGVKR